VHVFRLLISWVHFLEPLYDAKGADLARSADCYLQRSPMKTQEAFPRTTAHLNQTNPGLAKSFGEADLNWNRDDSTERPETR